VLNSSFYENRLGSSTPGSGPRRGRSGERGSARHFVITFHQDTFECFADDLTGEFTEDVMAAFDRALAAGRTGITVARKPAPGRQRAATYRDRSEGQAPEGGEGGEGEEGGEGDGLRIAGASIVARASRTATAVIARNTVTWFPRKPMNGGPAKKAQ
jgi:hypothetical protein